MIKQKKKTCGIYKITSPSGRVYIGQSREMEIRFQKYKRLDCKKQRRVYSSFMKYGVDSHSFEIVEECDASVINEKERYWQEFYNVTSPKGLNCMLVSHANAPQKFTEETRKKISKNRIGKLLGKENHLYKKGDFTKDKLKIIEKRTKIKSNYTRRAHKLVLDTSTGIFYYSCKEAAEAYNINYSSLRCMLNINKRDKNKTNLIYCYND